MTSIATDAATEVARQESLARYGLTDRPDWPKSDPDLVRLAAMAQRLLGADFSAINVFDDDRQVTVAGSAGVPLSVCSRSMSMCHRLLLTSEPTQPLVVADATRDRRLADSPYVNGEVASIRFYAAAPLIGREGLALGTVCVWSEQSAEFGEEQHARLAQIADAVVVVLDARRNRGAGPPAAAVSRRRRPASAWSVDAVIDDRAVRTVFQPIVHLETATIAGFEALSRGPAGSVLESPLDLIRAASDVGRLGELDWLCRTHALQAAAAAGLHPQLAWFVNVEPAGLTIDCPSHLVAPFAQAGATLRIVLEVVEREVEGHVTDLLHACDAARRDSWGVALDDVGAEDGSLALLPLLRPDVVKLDMSLLRGTPQRDAAATTAAVRAHAERTGAVVLAEGIETEEQERLARVFGATYGQGYRYGRPGPLPGSVPPPRHVIPFRQRLAPLAGGTPFEALSAVLGEPARAPRSQLQHIVEHVEDQSARSGHAVVLLVCVPERRHLSAADARRYERLAGTSALTVVLAADLDRRAEPRHQRGPLQPASAMSQEWAVIVVSPHYAAAFVARDCGDPVSGDGRYDYFYTHDRDAVGLAARCFLQELKPLPRGSSPA